MPLLKQIAKTRIPVIVSSGMSDWEELDTALNCFAPTSDIVVLQCTSDYPTSAHNVGLNVLEEMQERYNLPVGLSDHTLGSATSVAAVCFGACLIEKHFTISKDLYGPDARFSLSAQEFKQMVDDVKFVNECLKRPVDKSTAARFNEMKRVFQKSIVAKRFIPKGKVISIDDLAFKKPGTGICASKYMKLIGLRAAKDYQPDEMFTELGP